MNETNHQGTNKKEKQKRNPGNNREKKLFETITDEELRLARLFIRANQWTFAKTYAKTAPHEYCVRKGKDSLPHSNPNKVHPGYEWFIKLIRKYGVPEAFYRTHFVYLYLDGFKYWTMGAPAEETYIINRAKPKK